MQPCKLCYKGDRRTVFTDSTGNVDFDELNMSLKFDIIDVKPQSLGIYYQYVLTAATKIVSFK